MGKKQQKKKKAGRKTITKGEQNVISSFSKITAERRNATNAHTPNSNAHSYEETKQTFLTESPGSLGISLDI